MKERYMRAYGERYQLNSPNNSGLMRLFHQICAENGIAHDNEQIFEYLNTFEEKQDTVQMGLFD